MPKITVEFDHMLPDPDLGFVSLSRTGWKLHIANTGGSLFTKCGKALGWNDVTQERASGYLCPECANLTGIKSQEDLATND